MSYSKFNILMLLIHLNPFSHLSDYHVQTRDIFSENIAISMYSIKPKGKVIIELSRQKLDESMVFRMEAVLSNWGLLFTDSFTISRNSTSRHLVDTLSIIQTMSPTDVVVVAVACSKHGLFTPNVGVDRDLVEVFAENLRRTLLVYMEALSLKDLFSVYCELLDLSVTDVLFNEHRSEFGDSLLRRLKSNERIPVNFRIVEFLDAFSADLDEELMKAISRFMLERIQSATQSSSVVSEDELMDMLISVDSAFARLKLKPDTEFVEAVRLFISSSPSSEQLD